MRRVFRPEHPVDPLLGQPADGLAPAEDFRGAFTESLTEGVASSARRARIQARRVAASDAHHVRPNPPTFVPVSTFSTDTGPAGSFEEKKVSSA